MLNPLDYVRAVQIIKNSSDMGAIDATLRQLLPAATVMVITMTATTTIGEPLTLSELEMVLEACVVALSLDDARNQIVAYVESRMNIIAPNLSAVVGTTTAAKLMGAAGGLNALSKVPACNIQVRLLKCIIDLRVVFGREQKGSGRIFECQSQCAHQLSDAKRSVSSDTVGFAQKGLAPLCRKVSMPETFS